MAHMIGNTTVYTFYPEATYGVMPVTVSVAPLVIGQKVDMKKTLALVDRPLHTGTMFDTPCNTVNVGSEASVTIDGAYSMEYQPFLRSYLQNTGSSPLEVGTDQLSFTVFQYDSRYPTKCRYATGCKVKSLNLSVTNKDYVKMSVELLGKDLTDWVARPAMTGSYAHYSTLECHSPVPSSLVSVRDKNDNTVDNWTNISINMDSETVEDNVRFMNSATPVNQIMTKKMITVDLETLFDPTGTNEAKIISYDGVTVGHMVIVVQDQEYMLLVTNNDYTAADPDAGVWKNSYNLQAKDTTVYPAIEVTIA